MKNDKLCSQLGCSTMTRVMIAPYEKKDRMPSSMNGWESIWCTSKR
jgi:hypothetical protein